MITVDLKTQDTQLNPKQKPMPENVIESEARKNDMITVDLNTQYTQLNPKPNPMPMAGAVPKLQFKFIWCQQTLSLHFTICIWLVLLLLCCVMSQSKNVTRLAITLNIMKDHNFH